MNKKSKQVLSWFMSFIMIFFLVFNGWTKNVKAEVNNVYTTISAGECNTVAIDCNENVWDWGINNDGQLGTGDNNSSNKPVQVTGLNGKAIKAVSAGIYYTVALDGNGEVWSWGSNDCGQLGTGDNNNSNKPVQVTGLNGKTIVAISAAGYHTEALDSNGEVWSWGFNDCGQLGTGDNNNSNKPVQVTGLNGKTIVAISAGIEHTEALDSNGEVWSWGFNDCGQLGTGDNNNSNRPVQVKGLNGKTIIAISAGIYYTVALDSNGEVWSWGSNDCGQLGTGDNNNSNRPVQVKGLNGKTIVAISAGEYHAVALDSNGEVWSWGFNDCGQLGTGDNNNSNKPVQVTELKGKTIKEISAGGQYSVVLDNYKNIWGFGKGGYGQLGTGNNTDSNVPVNMNDADNVSADKASLAIGYASGDSSSSVTQNLTLPTQSANGTNISWSSNSQSVISNAGVVTRPDAGSGNKDVTLTATITKGSYSDTEDFTVTVLEKPRTIATVDFTSGTHKKGDTLKFKVYFDGNVKVTGTPYLPITLEGITRQAVYTGGSGSNNLNFEYTIQSGDNTNGIIYIKNGINPNGGKIVDATTNVPCNLNYSIACCDITVDTTPPTFDSLTGAVLDSDNKKLILTFSENIANACANVDALKNNITLSSDGTNFNALGANDTINIESGKLAINFDKPLIGTNNKIKIEANSLMDTIGNIKTDETETSDISGVPILAISIINPEAGTVNSPYNFNFSSSGGSGTKIYSLEDGNSLPSGLVLAQDGTLSGTPTSSGNFNFKVKVTDDSGQSSDYEYRMAIANAVPPAFSSAALASDNKNLTLTFSKNIVNACGSLDDLKNNITFSNDGTNFNHLDASEVVEIIDNKLVITFSNELTGASNKIKIAANSLKDADGNVKTDETETNSIAASGISLNLKFTNQSCVNIKNLNIKPSVNINGLKQYDFDLLVSKAAEIENAGVQANSGSVEIMDENNNTIGKVKFPSNIIAQIGLLNNVNVSFPVTIDGNNNFSTKTYMATLNMTTLPYNIKHFHVSFVRISVPDAPTNVTAASGNGCAVVSFTPPTNDGGSTITGYKVISNSGTVVGTGTGSPITVSGLSNGTTYNFKVVAVNAAGESAPSAVSNNVVPLAPYVPPTPQPITEVRTISVKSVADKNQTNLGTLIVVRTINVNGIISDTVMLNESALSQIIANALKNKLTSIDVILDDAISDKADSIQFQVYRDALKELQANNLSLNFETAKGTIALPSITTSEAGSTIIQVAFSEVSNSKTLSVINDYAEGAKQIGKSLEFDGNFSGDTEAIIPIMQDEPLTADELSKLAVMVQYSDGKSEVKTGTIVYDCNNKPIGIKIKVKRLSTFTLIELPDSTKDGNAQVIPYKVNADKVWTVNFSNNIDETTVNKDNVYVVDDEGNKVDVKLEVDGKALIISPVENYKSGHKYYLYISDKVQSVNKKTLKKVLEYEFNVI